MDKYYHISEEQIAAFLEGNLDAAESLGLINAITNDESIANIVCEANLFDEIDAIALLDGDFGYLEFGIDPVYNTEELLDINDTASIFSSNVLMNIADASETIDYEGNIADALPDNDEGTSGVLVNDLDLPSNEIVDQHDEPSQGIETESEYNNLCSGDHMPINNEDTGHDCIDGNN